MSLSKYPKRHAVITCLAGLSERCKEGSVDNLSPRVTEADGVLRHFFGLPGGGSLPEIR